MNATAKFPTPESITAEHEELHADLRALTRLPGRVGIVARDVADALHPHFLLDRLTEAAAAERRPEAARFAAGLKRHARTEEEVLYPAALLLGAYLRLRLGARAT